MVNLAYLHLSGDLFLYLGREHALHGILHLLYGVVDDTVLTYVHAFLFGQASCLGTGTHLEGYDDGIRSGGQGDIALADLTHGLVYHVDLYFLGGQTFEGVLQCLDRTVHIALDQQVELLEVAQGYTAPNLVEVHTLHGAQALLACQLFALGGYFSCLLVALHDVEGVACCGCTVQAQYGSCL